MKLHENHGNLPEPVYRLPPIGDTHVDITLRHKKLHKTPNKKRAKLEGILYDHRDHSGLKREVYLNSS